MILIFGTFCIILLEMDIVFIKVFQAHVCSLGKGNFYESAKLFTHYL